MKKDFGVKTWLLPMPVLMVGSYGDDGAPNVMTAAWGGTGSDDLLTVCIDSGHKTWANIEKRKAFTVAPGVESQVKTCDALGCVSGNKVPDKVAKAGWHVEKSSYVDAPVVSELPLVFECELVSMDANTCLVVGKVVNVAADESVLTGGKPDSGKIAPIAYDPINHAYRSFGAIVAQAFQGKID
jgi:flavin reductase (DIM6/NTAB) family NADH-FMN oxidoreductase RutF